MIGQLLAERYKIKEVKDAGRTFVAEDKYRPGYPLCLIQRIQGQGSSVQTRTMAKLMLEQRVEAIGRLGKFSQIPGVLNFIETETAIYLVEEIVSGYLLSQEILPDQPWSEIQATELMQEILEILDFMHQHRVVLRGLRPDNLVRRRSDGRLVLINLLMLPPKNTRIQGQINPSNLTEIYQPREQLEGNPVFSSNLYSLGMIALQAVTGLPAEALPTVKSHWFDRAHVSHEFAAVLDRLLSEDVKDRPATAQEVAKTLRSLHQPEVLEPQSSPTELIPPPPILAVHHAESGISPASEHPVTLHPASPTVLTPTPIPTVSLEPAHPPVSSDHGSIQGASTPMSGLPPAKQIAQAPVVALSPPPTVILRSPWQSKRLWGGLGLLASIGAWATWHVRIPQNAMSAYHLSQGQDRSSRSLYKSAIAHFNDALRWNKENSSAFFQRGYAFYQIRNLPQALSDFTQVINLDPSSSVAFSSLFYRGNIRMNLGDSQGAVRDYNQAIEVDSTDARAFVQRGQAENALGRSGNALKSYSQAIRLDPNLAAAYLNRCLTKSNLNDQPGAISDCTEATGINPTLITAYQNRGLAYHRAGNYRAAISDLNVAIKLDGEDATSYYQRGLIRLDLQDKEGAIGDFNTAIQFKSDHVFAYYQRGLVQEKYGNLDGAIADLEMAMKLCVEQGMTGCYRDAQYQLKRLGKNNNNNPEQPTTRNQNPVFNDSYSPPTTPLIP